MITNFHNIEIAENTEAITLSQPQLEEEKPRQIKQVLALDAENDLALLEVNPSVETHLTLGTLPSQIDETVFILGYPEGNFVEITNTGNTKQSEYFNTIPINHYSPVYGTSGSPVFDTQGQVTGVVSIVGDSFVHTIHLRHIQNLMNTIGNHYTSLEYRQAEIKKNNRTCKTRSYSSSVSTQSHISAIQKLPRSTKKQQ